MEANKSEKTLRIYVLKKEDRAKVLGNIFKPEDVSADCKCYTSCTRCSSCNVDLALQEIDFSQHA